MKMNLFFSFILILLVISYNVDIGLADDVGGSDEYDSGNDSENGTYYEPEWSGERCTQEELAA